MIITGMEPERPGEAAVGARGTKKQERESRGKVNSAVKAGLEK